MFFYKIMLICANEQIITPILSLIFDKEYILTNIPLNSNDQGKIVIFALLLAPSILFLIGIVPVILLAFGVRMMVKNQDFSSLDTAVKNFKGYYWLMLWQYNFLYK
jgi:hypothetical protein